MTHPTLGRKLISSTHHNSYRERNTMSVQRRLLALAFAVLVGTPIITAAKETSQEWEIVNPAGTIEIKYAKPAPRLTTLEGKTVVLRWNGKHNGDNVLNRVAELLAKQ